MSAVAAWAPPPRHYRESLATDLRCERAQRAAEVRAFGYTTKSRDARIAHLERTLGPEASYSKCPRCGYWAWDGFECHDCGYRRG